MKLRPQNFSMHSGDSKTLSVTVKDEAGAAVSLSGATVKWQLDTVNGEMKVSKDTTSGITVTDATGGVFEISLGASDTAPLSGLYCHEAQVTDSSGDVTTVLTGNVMINRDLIQ